MNIESSAHTRVRKCQLRVLDFEMILLILGSILLFAFVLTLLLVTVVVFYVPSLDFKYDERPSMLILLLKGLYISLRKKQGLLLEGNDALDKPGVRLKVLARDCRYMTTRINQRTHDLQPLFKLVT